MHGMVSLLDSQHYRLVENIWRELEKECGLAGVKVTPYPHFSWQVGTEYPEPQTEQAIQAIARETQSFTVRTNGLGIFSGPNPVVYIPIIRSPKMDRLHAKLWKEFRSSAKGISPFYSPQNWMPHITLVFGEESVRSVLCGLETLAFRSFDWEIEVSNISFVSQSDGQVGTLSYRHDFLPG
jgi:2'-5' RNA ligase